MKYHLAYPDISLAGIGSTQFWSGDTTKAENCLFEAINTYGITLVDTAEMYANGRCERIVGNVLASFPREKYYLLGKADPRRVQVYGLRKSLLTSLEYLKEDYFDLYLLHWREDVDLHSFVQEVEELKKEGYIKEWGVSNFDMHDMKDLLSIPNGENCYCNQILYNLMTRGPEYDLIPFLKEHDIMPMAYSSLGSSFVSNKPVKTNKTIQRICQENNITPEALMLSFVTRYQDFPALFSTSSMEHLRSNLDFDNFDILSYMDEIDREFPSPTHAVPLEKL